MAEVVIPEIKHEYIRQVDTETTKNDWFDECIADNKEAAWAGIGTGELDSRYQPSPVKEPDYYMQYCSSDDYDYLKDYRLIWGYGIGIIEQDVICSLSTGEHLAEGKDACNTYATENAAGENTDWKRGTWIKFSGNRNVSPTRIGEVILPERVISLKDLCAALQLNNDCHFVFPITNFDDITNTTVLNTSNMCGQNNHIIIDINSEVSFNMTTLNCSYMFANATIGEDITDRLGFIESLTQAIDFNHCFYKTKFSNTFEHIDYNNVLPNANVESMFEKSNFNNIVGTISYNGPVGKATFKNCIGVIDFTSTFNLQSDVESAFEGTTIINTGSRDETNLEDDNLINWNSIDFSKVTNAKKMFYNTTWDEDEVFLDLSSVVEHEDGCFDNFLYTTQSKTFNVKAPNVKIRGYYVFGNSSIFINIIGTLKYYEIWDKHIFAEGNSIINSTVKPLFYSNLVRVKGKLSGTGFFSSCNASNELNIEVTTDYTDYSFDKFVEALNFYNDNELLPAIFIDSQDSNNYLEGTITFNNYITPNNIFRRGKIKYTEDNNNIIKTYNIQRQDTIILFVSYGDIYNIDIDNNTNIYIFDIPYYVTESNIRLGYKSKVYINNVEENIKDIFYYRTNNVTSKFNYFVLDCPNCNVIINSLNENETIPYSNKNDAMDIYILNANNIVLNKYCISWAYDYRGFKQRIDNRLRINKCNQLILDWMDKASINENYKMSCLNILYNNEDLLNIKGNTSINLDNYLGYSEQINIIPVGYIYSYNDNILGDKLNIKYPILTHSKGNFKTAIWNDFVNYDANDFLKTIDSFKQRNVSLLFMGNDNIITNHTTNKILDYTKLILFYYIYINNQLEDYTIKVKGITNNTLYINENNNLNIESPSNIVGKLKEIVLEWHESESIDINKLNGSLSITYMCNDYSNNSSNRMNIITINKDCELTTLDINLKIGEGTNGYISNVYIYTNTIVNLFINNEVPNENNAYKGIVNNLDLSVCDKLTQESINSIVTPINFASSCTLTINTTPFQYITEEQKQALTNAGVTLVEYIPTETTE